jgi:hypothetical protein
MRINIFNDNFFYVETYFDFDRLNLPVGTKIIDNINVCKNFISMYFNTLTTLSKSDNYIISAISFSMLQFNTTKINRIFYKTLVKNSIFCIDFVPDSFIDYEICKINFDNYPFHEDLINFVPSDLKQRIIEEYKLCKRW